MKGSYTAEAACICPLILFSVIFLWYLGFYQHNRVVCQAICQEAVYKGLDADRCQRDAEAAMRTVLSGQIAYLFAAEDIRTEVSVTGTTIEAALTVRMRFPFGIWRGNGIDGDWVIEERARITRERPATVIRRLKRWKEGKEQRNEGRVSEGADAKLSGAGG